MITVKLFVEGGGNSSLLHKECRRSFNSFLTKAGLEGHMPRIVSCGSRNDAYRDYCTAINNGENAILLVDSESPIVAPGRIASNPKEWNPWHHLKNRQGPDGSPADNWNKPQHASNEDCHLMVELMETWFLADINTLKQYYGQGFNENCLPKSPYIESVPKDKVLASLEDATRNSQKGIYKKGNHSFKILALIDPVKVTDQSQWAKRFVVLLSDKMKAIH